MLKIPYWFLAAWSGAFFILYGAGVGDGGLLWTTVHGVLLAFWTWLAVRYHRRDTTTITFEVPGRVNADRWARSASYFCNAALKPDGTTKPERR